MLLFKRNSRLYIGQINIFCLLKNHEMGEFNEVNDRDKPSHVKLGLSQLNTGRENRYCRFEKYLRRVSFWMVRKNHTSKELMPPDDSNPYLDNAKLFFWGTTQNKTRLSILRIFEYSNFNNSNEKRLSIVLCITFNVLFEVLT